MVSLREAAARITLALVAVAIALACAVALVGLLGLSALVSSLLPDVWLGRNVVSVAAWLVGAVVVLLLAREAFRAIEMAARRRSTESVAGGALGGAALGLVVGTLIRDAVYGSDASVYAPIYLSAFSAAWLGHWLHTRVRARRQSGAV